MISVKKLSFVIGFGLVQMSFLLWNLYLFSRSHETAGGAICFDCGLPVGFPFTMYRTDYMWGGEGFIASGVFANICVALIVGSLVGFVVSGLSHFMFRRFSANRLS